MWRMGWSTLVYITTLQPLLCSTCGHCCCVPASEGTRGHHWCRGQLCALNPSHSSLPSAECWRNTAVFSHLCLMQQHLKICTHFLCSPLRSSLISFDNLSRGNRHGTLWVQATNSFFTNLSTVQKETLIKNGNFQCNMYLNDGPAETE